MQYTSTMFQSLKMNKLIFQLNLLMIHFFSHYFESNFLTRGFFGSLITNLKSDFEISENSRCNLQYDEWKIFTKFLIHYFGLKFITVEFLRSLITNLKSDFENFENPRWQMQHDGWQSNTKFNLHYYASKFLLGDLGTLISNLK